nr:caspase family protein [bacterium]
FSKEDGLAGNDTLCIETDTMGRVWVGTTEGLSVYSDGTWTTYTQADGLMRNDPVELYVDHLGRVWCGFWRGVNVYYRDQWWTWERDSVDYVYGIQQDLANKTYCSTKGGFAVYDGEKWSRILNSGDLRKRLMSSVVSDRDGNIWCAWGGLDKGVSIFNGTDWANVTSTNTKGGLASDRTVDICRDDLGRMWFGARDGEVSILIPDGAPGIRREDVRSSFLYHFQDSRAYASLPITPHSSLRQLASRVAQSLTLLQFPCSLQVVKKDPIPGLLWEPPLRETITDGVLLAQAGGSTPAGSAPTTQIQIAVPAGLMTATKEAPFTIQGVQLDLQGMIGSTEKIDKVEVNGFQVTLQPGMSMGNQNFYNFTGSVMVPGITVVRFDLFQGEKSVFTMEYPVNVPAKEFEKEPPTFQFIDPNVPEDKVVAARSGQIGKIEIQLSVQQTGMVRGIAIDDTGVKEVKVNGDQAFIQDPAPSVLRQFNIKSPEGCKYFEQSFSLKTGPNTVTIEAVDVFNNIAPLALDLFVQELLSDATFYESSWALIIGIDKYRNWTPLTNAVRDATGMRELLETTYKFPKEQIIEVCDDAATREGIMAGLNKISQAAEGSRVVIFYAGHGQTLSSRKGDQGFLVPVDGAFVPVSEHPTLEQIGTWISMEDLSRQLGFFNAKHVLLVVDACYSGLLAAKRGAQLEMIQQDKVTAHFLELAEEPAIEVITAGEKNEQVQDGGYKGHSVFTGFLIRGLETGEADLTKDGVITTEELGTYAWQNVQQATNNQQHPRYCKLPGYEEEKGTVLFTVPGGGV